MLFKASSTSFVSQPRSSIHFARQSTSKRLSKTCPKLLQQLPSCHHAEVVSIAQSFGIFRLDCKKNAKHAVPTFMEQSFNTSDHVSPQIDAVSRVPHMPQQSLASLHFRSYLSRGDVKIHGRASAYMCALNTPHVAISIGPSV